MRNSWTTSRAPPALAAAVYRKAATIVVLGDCRDAPGALRTEVQRSMKMSATLRRLYQDYLLTCSALSMDDGRFQARVAIADFAGDRTRRQIFLDLELFPTADEAVAHAEWAGLQWVDKNGGRTLGP